MPQHHYILLADDSDSDALLTRMRLKKSHLHHTTIRVLDGAQAVAYLGGEGEYADRSLFPFPSVLLLDLHMPKVDGFEVLEWLSRQPGLHRLVVVVMSNAAPEDVIHRVYQAGAHAFFCKGCTTEDFHNMAMFLDGFFNSAWSGQFVAMRPPPPENRLQV